jgi:hypothetical protein
MDLTAMAEYLGATSDVGEEPHPVPEPLEAFVAWANEQVDAGTLAVFYLSEADVAPLHEAAKRIQFGL